MAADLNLEWISLPRSWTYGITRGGRVFFINEEAKSTTWLHPVTGEAVVTGHRRQSTDLPTGWEEAYTFEGARYYINWIDFLFILPESRRFSGSSSICMQACD
ncbi:PREDICTED: pleckstrin homology domain-containing family A member 5 isoform X5 [Colobus angolensis palliatus]|uniref:WW domain-containing protein n=1 Tax=Colobus angolensis palliatus TaxID=336983 RepID=A0A2K5JY58_COLAP|nr:PREDICTED: pleckstrin homology domain-containing family A member 5 isoform X5 [Colobus angolensis palliatus]